MQSYEGKWLIPNFFVSFEQGVCATLGFSATDKKTPLVSVATRGENMVTGTNIAGACSFS